MKGAKRHLELSLKRLGTDYIDIWQFHGVNDEKAYKRLMKKDGAMMTAKEGLLMEMLTQTDITIAITASKETNPTIVLTNFPAETHSEYRIFSIANHNHK